MATDYFSDNEAFITSHPLPSPANTQYHSVSRRTSRYGTPASEAPSSPAPMPPTPRMGSDDVTDDENISVLDPRRFTPTLHASLVSEILNLRRELDSKHKFIEDLETNLHTVRTENDTLTSELSSTTKEGRTLKRQLQQLENGTLSALEEIASERDKAKEANADLKEKLEATQKKLKGQEDDSTRVHDMWAREKDVWAGEKRALERRVHVTETRLKLLLDEIAMQEAAIEEEVDPESEGDELARDGGVGHESDTASVRSSPQRRPSSRFARHSRNHSNSSFRSIGRNYRMSLMSVPGSEGTGRVNGVSLADELIFDEEEEEYEELEIDSDDFPENEMRARRALESRQSMYPDEKAKRILGLSLEKQHGNKDIPSSTPEDEPPKSVHHTAQSSATITPQEITLIFPPPGPMYVDTGYQPSPPSSPVRPDTAESSLPAKSPETGSSLTEVEANQSRKRVSVPIGAIPQYGHIVVPSRGMTSSSSQTVEQPLSPPDTPKIDIPATQIPASPVFKPEVASVSTQTDPAEEPAVRPSTPPPPPLPTRAPPPAPLPIPSIAIHAPTSAPASPKEPILPPGTKTIGTQTSGDMTGSMCSTGMQTEPIRIDKRPVKLPPHLLPSSISSKPGTPEPGKDRPGRKDSAQPVAGEAGQSTARPNARQDLLALLERVADRTTDKTAEKTVEDRYPGNNDNGPLARDRELGISRPFRTSSLFAGFDGPSSDEEDNDAELSDDEEYRPTQYSTPMLSSRNLKNGRVFNNPPTPVPEDKEVVSNPRPSEDSVNSSRMLSNRSSMEKPAKVGKPIRTSITRQSSIRRSAMIQNGTAAHMRSRSPSIGSVGSNNHTTRPPFPVPTRSSSRKIPLSKSEGSQSPTSRNSGTYSGRRPYGTRQHQRKDSLRKVRSAAVIQKSGRSGSRSPPLPATPTIPPSPSLPPLPNDLITGRNYGHRHQLSTNTSHTGSASVGSAGQQANVVDAIAATMIGEFMWKYVRKRKTFGGPEPPADVSRTGEDLSSNGVRHRRWVWISPYERSILWSTKQPTSNSALMGKSGRKLTIQSVLDVADNTPLPKNAGTQALFNRSILILTPARALKFTAISRERHYMWLTALSFLAHSSSPIPEMEPAMPIAPPAPMEELAPRSQGATLRRSHVRDSVRLAKGKANPVASRYAMQNEPLPELYPRSGADRPVPDSASPPSIPRGPYHGRKRSSTGPGAPPPSIPYRSFSHQHVPSLYSNGSSDMYSAMAPPSVPSSVYNPHSAITSSRTSEASTSTRQNFFDTMGTVRMEAFIDGALGDPNKRSEHARPRMMGRRRNSQWSSSTTNDLPLRVPGLYEDLTQESNDPFRGF